MLVAFCYGFFTAVLAILAAAIYGFTKAKEYSQEKLASAVATIQQNPKEVESAASLHPVRVISNVKVVMCSPTGAGETDVGQVPLTLTAASNSRLVMLGTTISLYETLATAEVDAKTVHPSSEREVVTAERFVGKISTRLINHKILTIEDVRDLFSYTTTLPAAAATATANANLAGLNHNALASAAAFFRGSASSQNDKSFEDYLKERIVGRLLMLTINHDALQKKGQDERPVEKVSIFLTYAGAASEASGDASQRATAAAQSLSPGLLSVSRLLILFSTKRDLDRWANIFLANTKTSDWKQYLRTLPSLDLLNLLAARVFFENTSGPAFANLLHKKISKKLRAVVLPKHVTGHIEVVKVLPGGEIPLISNVSFASLSASGEVGFDFDVHYRGGFQVTFAASLSVSRIRIPQMLFHVKILEIGGRTHVSIGPPPSSKFWAGFHAPPNVRLEFSQEVASHEGVLSSLISMLPDLSEVISNFVKVEMFEDMLLPNFDEFPLPNVGDQSSDDDEVDGSATAPAQAPQRSKNKALVSGKESPSPAVMERPFVVSPAESSLQSTPTGALPQWGSPDAAVTTSSKQRTTVSPSLRAQAVVSNTLTSIQGLMSNKSPADATPREQRLNALPRSEDPPLFLSPTEAAQGKVFTPAPEEGLRLRATSPGRPQRQGTEESRSHLSQRAAELMKKGKTVAATGGKLWPDPTF